MRHWFVKHGAVAIGSLVIIGWVVVVTLSGRGVNATGIAWNFERTGQLGDSFGVLGAIMASIAAYFAFRTYQAAREDVRQLERRAAEPSYLNLLERRFDVLSRVRSVEVRFRADGYKSTDREGHVALDHIASGLRFDSDETDRSDKERFIVATNGVSGLSNLFRFTYHIIAFADRQFSEVPKSDPMIKSDPGYQMVRLLRAQMSDSELALVALNCAYGAGFEKFKPLVERYALLHNMDPTDIAKLKLRDLFELSAFGVEPDDRIAGDDGPPVSGDVASTAMSANPAQS